MKVTADANVLFSSLLRDGMTRSIWFSPVLQLYAPKFMLKEFTKYRAHLIRKYAGTETEFNRLLENIISCVVWIPDEDLKPFIPAAISLTEDQKDILYLACALKEGTIIWSNDKHLKKQKRIPVKTTPEMAEEYGHL